MGAPGAGATEADRILGLLRRQGGRVTSVRRAVVTALLDAPDHHVTANDLAARVQAELPDVHRSTIYRTLEALEDVGVVEQVHLGGGEAVYHLAEEHSHRHLVCEACGRVIEVPDELFDDLAATLDERYGFSIRPSHFALLGQCAACRAAAPGRPAGSGR